MIVDMGYAKSYHRTIKSFLAEKNHIDLLVVTHTDSDHIGGALSYIKDDDTPKLDCWWYNYSINDLSTNEEGNNKISINQAISLRAYLSKKKEAISSSPIIADTLHVIKGIEINILSPSLKSYKEFKDLVDKKESYLQNISAEKSDYKISIRDFEDISFPPEDNSPSNGSSIAFILNYGGFKILMLADAHPKVIVESLRNMGYSEEKPLLINYVKLSHHGSARNINSELIELIECSNYIISTDGSNHALPNKLTLAKIAIQSRKYFQMKI
jgi:beta-lactamase superfamily II metal-dependent hydrolase